MTRSTLSFAEACAQERVEVLTSVQRRPQDHAREVAPGRADVSPRPIRLARWSRPTMTHQASAASAA